jgi:hypothetical protein
MRWLVASPLASSGFQNAARALHSSATLPRIG